ncbi:MAG: SpoIID/LytB domain-containing protein, partial [Anaerolineae bacterium]
MYRLNSDGSKYQPEEPCSSGNTNWGCTAFDKDHYPPEQRRPYPYATNPVTVSIESDYLLDVVPQEMNPGLFHPTALRAQAIAARSFAYWHIHQGSNINNSIQFQAFIPYKFESLNSGEQQAISDAIAPRYYISYSDDSPALTEFSSAHDGVWTEAGDKPYLQRVYDPIPASAPWLGHGRGMSQYHAQAWVEGEHQQSGFPQWGHYEQILAHYYTGIHIR